MEEIIDKHTKETTISNEFLDGVTQLLENESRLKKENLADYLYYKIKIETDLTNYSTRVSLIQSLFKRYNWNKKIADQWLKHKSPFEHPFIEQTMCDLRQMAHLNKNDPDIVNTLFKDFNIIHFGNYPIEMLTTQYFERDNHQKPYGLVIFPKFDWNGIFMNKSIVFHNFFDQLQKTSFLVRVIECATSGDLVKNFIRLDKRYGTFHKITFALIGAHGSRNSLDFGNPQDDIFSTVYKKDLNRGILQDIKGYLIPHPTIILSACSTGQEKGIAQKLAQRLEAFVIAPECEITLCDLSVQQNGDNLQLNVSYAEGKTCFYKPDIADIKSVRSNQTILTDLI